MGRRPGSITATQHARLFHRALVELGVPPGTKVPRDVWDDLVMVGFEVGNDVSVRQKSRLGQAMGLWVVVQAHGQGGRGHVIFNPEPTPATVAAVAPVAVPA